MARMLCVPFIDEKCISCDLDAVVYPGHIMIKDVQIYICLGAFGCKLERIEAVIHTQAACILKASS